jgi:hypothetical protein
VLPIRSFGRVSTFYKVRPQAKSQITKAPGYAVFSDANINIIFASFGGGYGGHTQGNQVLEGRGIKLDS